MTVIMLRGHALRSAAEANVLGAGRAQGLAARA